ncbi:MAG: DNA recombination protein RmuC [Methylococcales bacterium]|nr:DNA recombination protein RmuC [Methylococcales bacterium]MBT4068866.1 DNA recombination protein RmuC [Candidatus Neomarinimicrobiota bacterium]MBT3506786.1 DNA recombination protein RmuC [Methylococcales bacterium]MBT3699722.1 DNA recombination protein RmuC [Methylococcales bacterium]MBT4348489.1 DNA recombination protein RmuC [Methylococcales bacterium]
MMGLWSQRSRRELEQHLLIAKEKLLILDERNQQCECLQEQLTRANILTAQLQARLEEQQKHGAEKLKLLQDAEIQLKLQFENLANQIFEAKTKQFKEQNNSSLNEIVSPLKEQLGDFKKRIEHVYEHETRDRVTLREEISQLRQDTQKMNQEALNLTRALKGDNKTQGNWGEMILEKVLEESGLRKGIEYDPQGAFRNDDNSLFKPDVIIRLPGDKDVVVDSKVSLVAYERYCSTEDDGERIKALKEHTLAVRQHIKGLSEKDYSSLKGLRSLDFVLLFMPIEAAFMAAFQADEKVFADAFEHKIIVVTPTTLLATLRTIENIWRYERRNENARIIAEKAGSLYDKIRGFVEDLDKLGNQLSTVNKTYTGVMGKLTQGQGNLIRQANSFVELGVKVKKAIPKNISEQAQLGDDDN